MPQAQAIHAVTFKQYKAKQWSLRLEGFSDEQLQQHYKLYQAYVEQANQLLSKIGEFHGSKLTPEISELKRRFSFEYDGMKMHELYFDNLMPGKSADKK